MLCFEIISFEEFILFDDVSLMTCCYTLREFMSLKIVFFYVVSLNFCEHIQDNRIPKKEF